MTEITTDHSSAITPIKKTRFIAGLSNWQEIVSADRLCSMSLDFIGSWRRSNQDIYRLAVLISNLLSRNLATSTTASLSFLGASRNLRG